MASQSDLDAVQQRWGAEDFQDFSERAFWMNHRVVQGHLNRLSTGDSHCDWLTWFTGEFPPTDRPQRVLVLGCGEGWLERAIAHHPWIERIDACDVAEGAVQRARERAHSEGLAKIHYDTVDLNAAELPADTYDVVIAHSVLHHVENLELLFDQLVQSMKPDAWIAINEFVGPPHLQYREEAMVAMNEIMAVLPARLRWDIASGERLERKLRPDRDFMLATDPSEGVRADELDGFIRDRFELAYEVDMGGTVLQHLLWGLVANFVEEDPIDELMLEWICLLEESMIESGSLESDYRFYIGRPKGAGHTKQVERLSDSRQHREPDPEAERTEDWRRTRAAREHFHRIATGDPSCDWFTQALDQASNLGVGEDARVLWLGPEEHWMLSAARERFATVVPFRWSLLARPWTSFDLVLAPTEDPWAGRGARLRMAALALLLRRDGVLITMECEGTDDRGQMLTRRFGQALVDAVGGAVPSSTETEPHPSRLSSEFFFSERGTALGGGLLHPVLHGTFARVPEESSEDLVGILATAERLLLENGEALSLQQGRLLAGPRRAKLFWQLWVR